MKSLVLMVNLLTKFKAIEILEDRDLEVYPRIDSDTLAEAPKWPYDKISAGQPGSAIFLNEK